LIRERLGQQLSRPRLKALQAASGGSPMFALELMRQGGENGAGRLPTLPLALAERLRELDPGARRAATTAAAALRPSSAMLLAAGVARAELEAALAAGILELDGERLLFPHPLLATAALGLALPDEQRKIHAQLAALSVDAVERGHHVAQSTVDRDESAAEVLERAADEAAALGDHASSAAFLLRAAQLSAHRAGEAAQMREVAAGRELFHAGDVEAATVLCRRLVEQLPAGIARARARQILTWCLVGSERSYEEGIADLALALKDCESDDLARADMRLQMAEMSLGMCRLEQAVAHAKKAREIGEGAGPTMTAVQALAYVGFAESMLGLGVTEAAREAFEHWDMTVTSATSPRMLLACVCIPATRFDEAEELLKQEIAWAREHGLEAVEAVARAHLAETELRAGGWQEGLANASAALEHARQSADPQIVTGISYALAMLEASVGNHDDARAIAIAALAEAESTRDFWFTASHRAVLGQIAITENDAASAIVCLEPAWALMLERRLRDISNCRVGPTLAGGVDADGDRRRSLSLRSSASWPFGEQPGCRAMASRIEALVASARGEHTAAQAAFTTAFEAHSDLPEPFEHARTLLLVGRAERRARNWGAARTALVDAFERFERLGAAAWVENTRAEIARLPGRRPADKDTLTTREQEVAELVASGLANKEVAARLHVSLRTVEATLSKVYAKVGVRSRTELAARTTRDVD
jgi:DNA-binding CsgD family transcriptional regulator